MRGKSTLMILAIECFLGYFAGAQEFGPETPVLGKTILGYNGVAVLDVSSPTEFSYNPAAVPVALELFQRKRYLEFDFGTLNFEAGPEIQNDWQYIAFSAGKGSAMRVGRYTISSGLAETAATGPGIDVGFSGQTYEIAYGKKLAPEVALGAALLSEEIDTTLYLGDIAAGRASARSDFHWRLGALWLPNAKASVGLVYTQDRIDGRTVFSPIITGLPEELELTADYQEKLWTYGATWMPVLGTIINFSRQEGKINGPNVSEEFALNAYFLQQYLCPELSLTLGLVDHAPNYQAVYQDNGWTAGVSFSRHALRRSAEYLGTADTSYFWIGRSL